MFDAITTWINEAVESIEETYDMIAPDIKEGYNRICDQLLGDESPTPELEELTQETTDELNTKFAELKSKQH